MGRGDKKTKKGKIAMGSFGNSRKRKKKPTFTPKIKTEVKQDTEPVVKKPKAKKAAKKKAAKKTEK
ncbi:MAG: 30S ribosomal protein THX [Cyclobacteriaceae bacterium]